MSTKSASRAVSRLAPRRRNPTGHIDLDKDRGRKPVYLPNFTLTLLRTPFLPPTMATFITPLNINKLDMKSYLLNAYGVRVRAVRSYVQQQRVRQDKPTAKRVSPRRWYRPRSIKKMTVEMDMAFAWPDEVDDFSAWDKETFEAVQKEQERERDAYRPDAAQKPPTSERESIAAQAKRLLKGEDRWRPTWEDFGEPVEVETDVRVA